MWRLSTLETSFCVSNITADNLSMCNTFGYRERDNFDHEASVLGIIYTRVYKRDRVSVGAPAVYTIRIAIRPCDTSFFCCLKIHQNVSLSTASCGRDPFYKTFLNNISWLCLVLTSSIFMERKYFEFTYAGGKGLSELRRLFADTLQVRVWSWDGSFGIQCNWDSFLFPNILFYWSQWLRGLVCRSAARRLLELRVRIPPGAWMSVLKVVSCQVDVL
jgi:hypothetical protein